jgi:hypothetical protein
MAPATTKLQMGQSCFVAELCLSLAQFARGQCLGTTNKEKMGGLLPSRPILAIVAGALVESHSFPQCLQLRQQPNHRARWILKASSCQWLVSYLLQDSNGEPEMGVPLQNLFFRVCG